MSYAAYHTQDPFDNWTGLLAQAYAAGNPFRAYKSFHGEDFAPTQAASPGIPFIYRFWADQFNQGAWIEAAGQGIQQANNAADDFISKFKDGLLQHIGPNPAVPVYVESVNEEYPTGNPTKLYNIVQFDRAVIRRLPIHLPGYRAAVFTAACGNPGHDEYDVIIPLAEECAAAGGAFGYHGYWSVVNGNSFVASEQHAYDLHLRNLLSLDPFLTARGIYVTHYIGESGAIGASESGYWQRPDDGWKHSEVWAGNEDAYLNDIKTFDSMIAATPAAQQGRFLAFTLFTSNPQPDNWKWFRVVGSMAQKVADYVTVTPTPGDPPPPPPPPPSPPGNGDNLLPNWSFENGWWHKNDVPELQIANGWDAILHEGSHPNYPGVNFVRPECRVLPASQLPPEERPLFILDGEHTVKVFKGSAPILFRYTTKPFDLPAGKYRYTPQFYSDLVMAYQNGQKVFADDPGAGTYQFVINGQNMGPAVSPFPFGRWHAPAVEFDHPGGLCTAGVRFVDQWGLVNNGWFMDAGRLELVEGTPPPPPPDPGECRGAPRVQYARTVRVMHPAVQQVAAHDVLDLAWMNRNSVGWSFDDGGIGDLDVRKVIIHGAPAGEQQALVNWYAAEYPGVAVSFAPVFQFALWPVQNNSHLVNSAFNTRRFYNGLYYPHEGIDLYAQLGNPILAVYNGVADIVERNPDSGGYGIYVRLVHSMPGGVTYRSWYTHLSSIPAGISVGTAVTAGQTVGLAGDTGNVTGPHLHLTLQRIPGGMPGYIVSNVVDPTPYLQAVT